MKKIVFILLLFIFIVPSTAMAKSLWEHQSVTVPVGETISDVYVVGGDAFIFGEVTGSVVVINGNAEIKNTAHIHGLVIVVGGKVLQEPGAEIVDDVYSISFDDSTKNSLLIGGGLVLGFWGLQLAGSLLMILLPVFISLLGKRRAASMMDKYRLSSIGQLLYTGFFSGLILSAVTVLLVISIIGIPLLLVIILLLLIAFMFGLTVISYRLGELFQGTADRGVWLKVLIGAAVITAFSNIPLIGIIVLIAVIWASLGISTLWLSGKIKRKKDKKI